MQKKRLAAPLPEDQQRLLLVSKHLDIKERADSIRLNSSFPLRHMSNDEICLIEDAVMKRHKFMLQIYVNFLQKLLDDIPFDNERKRFGVLQLPGGEWRETFDDVLADISAIINVIDEL